MGRFAIRLHRPSPGTVLGGLALIVATGGVAIAAIPSGDGTVTMCVDRYGKLRSVSVVDADEGQGCPARTTSVKVLGTTAKAADSNLLDGLDSAAFTRLSSAQGTASTDPGGSTMVATGPEVAAGGPSVALARIVIDAFDTPVNDTVSCSLSLKQGSNSIALGTAEVTLANTSSAVMNLPAMIDSQPTAGSLELRCRTETNTLTTNATVGLIR